MKEYDLIVVGTGAGLGIVNQGLSMGLKCALVESGKMGGTCLTRGCIPSKVLTYAADAIRSAEHASAIGVQLDLKKIDWDTIASRMWSQINESSEIEKGISGVKSLALYRGIGEFTGVKTMRVKMPDGKYSADIKGERIVLASGARSFIPPVSGIEEAGYVTTETFFGDSFPKKPWGSIILIGGGIIAAEFAHIFSAFGAKVTVIEAAQKILNTEDEQVSAFAEKNFRKRMTLITGHTALSARKESGAKYVTVKEVSSGKIEELKAEEIFVCAGRRSNSDILKTDLCGIETYGSGQWIKTNPYLETNVDGVWAIGDANGLYQFRHKANAEAEVCINNMFGPQDEKHAMDYSSVPWAIFTDPQIGHVGLTEREAIEKGHQIYRAVKRYSSVAKGFAMGYEQGEDDDGFVKLIIDRSMRILGAHVVGPHAEMLVQPFVYLMNAGFNCGAPASAKDKPKVDRIKTKQDFACPGAGSVMPIYNSMVIHPSLNEVAGWALGALEPVNIPESHDHHHHNH